MECARLHLEMQVIWCGHMTDHEARITTEDAFLGGGLKLRQPAQGYRAGLDALLLAAAVPQARAHFSILDAGAGVGTAGLALAHRMPNASVILVERSPLLADLAGINIDLNDLRDRVRIVQADLLGSSAVLDGEHKLFANSFDVVMANPPYDEAGRGRAPPDDIKAAANIMPAAELDGWLRFLARMAKPDGLLVMIHRADALDRLLTSLSGRFGGIDILPIHPRPHSKANRILIRARKGSRAPISLLHGLTLHPPTGNGFVPEIDAILRHGQALTWPSVKT